MATPTTVNGWLDQLSASILQESSRPSTLKKKLQDNFRRQVRRHAYARTNQFEVAEHLDGLEEKFQVLSLDNLADALHLRRNELKEYQNQWIPDILDLFLQLSGDPARSEKLLELYRIPIRVGTPPPLRWKDIIAESPINKKDQLWRVPSFRDTDDSGYEDSLSSPSRSPVWNAESREEVIAADRAEFLDKYLIEASFESQADELYNANKITNIISETTFITESILLVRGLPTQIFNLQPGICRARPSVRIGSLSHEIVQSLATRLDRLQIATGRVRRWVSINHNCIFVTILQDLAQQTLRTFDKSLDLIQGRTLTTETPTVASLIQLLPELEHEAIRTVAIAEFLEQSTRCDEIGLLQNIFQAGQVKQLTCDSEAFAILSSMFWSSLRAYLKPIIAWILHGTLDESDKIFIVQLEGHSTSQLWQNSYRLQLTGENRPPEFLIPTAERILACGKTSALLKELGFQSDCSSSDKFNVLLNSVSQTQSQDLLPIGAAFQRVWSDALNDLLVSRTEYLKEIFTNRCGLQLSLDGLGTMYLGLEPDLFHDIERRVFERIDRCLDNWNDRFELSNMLEDALTTCNKRAMFDSIAVHSMYTSSRTMQSRRTSVKILAALSFRYSLPWPLANIIEERAMIVYGRIALFLRQVKRAKHLIERVGYLNAMHVPLGEDCGLAEQQGARFLSFYLHTFVSTLTSHFMMSTIEPMTTTMRRNLASAVSMDDMVEVHKQYILHLEYSCLMASKLRLLHHTVLSMLDLCVRFADLVSHSTQNEQDGEAHSFTSANSMDRTGRVDSDSEDDNGPTFEGYSSFIVLDHDSSIAKELVKVRHHFEKHLKSLVVGLKGFAAAEQHAGELSLLADRLTWTFQSILG